MTWETENTNNRHVHERRANVVTLKSKMKCATDGRTTGKTLRQILTEDVGMIKKKS